jgi:hypothetical protein
MKLKNNDFIMKINNKSLKKKKEIIFEHVLIKII